MAEAVGVVASGISIALFAIQIIGSIQTIYDFWRSIEGAPEDIGNAIEELWVLAAILKNLPDTSDLNGSSSSLISVSESLQHCRKALDDLHPIVSKLHGGMMRSRRQKQWAIAKTVLGKGAMRDLNDRLERSKSTLGLAVTCYNV